MHSNLYRLLAYVLLLLLPLQTVAAGAVVACSLANAPEMLSDFVMEDCDDPAMVHASTPDLSRGDARINLGHEIPDRSVPCGMGTSCLALASVAVLSDIKEWRVDLAFSPIDFAEELYVSHIPEGLQRPPQVS